MAATITQGTRSSKESTPLQSLNCARRQGRSQIGFRKRPDTSIDGYVHPKYQNPKQSPSEDNPFENMLSDIPTHSPTGTPRVLTPEQSSTNLVAVDTQHHEVPQIAKCILAPTARVIGHEDEGNKLV